MNGVRDDEFQSQVIATLREIAAKLPARDGVTPEPVDGST
jgi:hypothetical protein